jgi:hypothetical protein
METAATGWPAGSKIGAATQAFPRTASSLSIALPTRRTVASAASGYVCPVDDAAESFVVGVVIAPDDVPADHAGLLLVTGVVGAVEREVPQRRELRLYSV